VSAHLEFRHLSATAIFDPEDGYARRRGLRGLHPRPIGPVTYWLVGRAGAGGLERFEAPLEMRVRRNPSGYDLFFGRVAPAAGDATTLADGVYAVRVLSPYLFYQPAERPDIAVPRPDTPYLIDLEPAAAYPFPTETTPGLRGPTLLRGTYVRHDGTSITGATVQVPGASTVSVTDSAGQWVLVLADDQPTGNVTVRFQAPDGTVETVPGVLVVGGQEASLRQTALRGWTLATTGGAPMGGANVTVSGQPAPVQSGRDGSWSYHFPFAQPGGLVSVTASLPDGRTQTQPDVLVQPRVTNVVPTFHL
jgi:hypothetical protein